MRGADWVGFGWGAGSGSAKTARMPIRQGRKRHASNKPAKLRLGYSVICRAACLSTLSILRHGAASPEAFSLEGGEHPDPGNPSRPPFVALLAACQKHPRPDPSNLLSYNYRMLTPTEKIWHNGRFIPWA